jgi:hypothetical protein
MTYDAALQFFGTYPAACVYVYVMWHKTGMVMAILGVLQCLSIRHAHTMDYHTAIKKASGLPILQA